ncbi:MAG TPA: PLP-dependent aminotransferase family protein [Bryobacteraceae bacterium]|nr:PLP-dependent aminotransferase family protein [Bryobacteraceae bacterium]
MIPKLDIQTPSECPFYRQVYEQVRAAILSGKMSRGEKLPPTRELAGSIGLNRTTITAAYELLEADGLIKSHVGRGSFVEWTNRVDWESIIPSEENLPAAPSALISFSASRPSELQFPLDEFRATCREVIDSKEAANILQLGPASGYGPLRRFVLEQLRLRGEAGPDDDILITSGCQQAFDLIQRVLASHGETVVVEDPVYPGVRSVFQRGGARVIGAPMGPNGVDPESLERIFEKEHPRLMVLTPNFQNPTGATIPEDARKQIIDLARRSGVIIVEDDLYGSLRYSGEDVPALKKLDDSGDVILLGSFSKIAFPGLRVGWCAGPKHFIARLSEAKELSDLHSDQLSQAVLLRFAETGRLAAHRKKMLAAGAERLRACMAGCEKELPPGSEFTRPEGGMNLWVKLPEPLDASELAVRAGRENVSFTPGKYFAVSRPQTHGLRLCFAAMTPENVRYGLQVLGVIFRTEFQRARKERREPVPALV